MDSYHHRQQQQQNWYPSSSPPPPPPGGGGAYHHLPAGYPPIPHHHQWPPMDSRHHQFQPPSPAPYGHSPAVPSPYSVPPPPPHLQHQYPTPPLPPRPHYPMPPPTQQQQMAHQHQHPPMPPPHSAFPPPPNQAWGNPSWGQHQGWEHPDRNISYNNEEDWAARARAWAAAKSGTENHHTQPHFTPTGRADEHNYAYHDHYQQTIDAQPDMEQLSRPQSSIQHLPITSSGSSSYNTGYRAGEEAIASDRDHMASPQKRGVPSASVYEQEVPYSYSSAPGKREVFNQAEGLHVPIPSPMPSIQEGHHSLPSVPIQMSSVEQPHYTNHGQPKDFFPDARDRPLEFEPRPSADHESHEKLSYGHSGPTGVMGVMDHSLHAPPISSWGTSAITSAGYPRVPLGPSGTQFDPSFVPHASLPVHPAPVFGGMPVPSFQHNMPHVSSPFGLGPGSSLHHSAAFPVDANGLSFPERPKKAAVPNWLREEIIKKKAVISSTVPMQPTGSSLDSLGPEDSDKSLRRADQADSKSIDSTKSTEDEEDDEEDVEAARSAAINQEIKRVLTEVLLKVTDELFDEIATKVLNEDKLTVEVEENPVHGKQVSSPAAISTPKAFAKILVPAKMEKDKVNGVTEDSRTSSPGGDILGLGNYASDASDDDGDDKIRNSILLPSGKRPGTYHQPESSDKSSGSDLRSEGNRTNLDAATQNQSARLYEGNSMTEKGSLAANNLKYDKKASERVSSVCEAVLADRKQVEEFPLLNGKPLQSNNILDGKDGRKQGSTSSHENHDKLSSRDSRDREPRSNSDTIKNSLIMEVKDNTNKVRREISDGKDSVIHEDWNKPKEKLGKKDMLKERDGDRISKRATNEVGSDSRRSSKHNNSKDDRKEITKDKRDGYKDVERKRERGRDEEDRSTQSSKSSSRHTSKRSPSSSSRGKSSKDNSFSHGSASGDEPSDSSRKRKQQSVNSSFSPSPTKSRKRQVSRSPPSKHSHRRHSPYPSSERRKKRSRSISPVHRRSTAHKHE
ncbi:uncharacterized protein M6B38_384285 [Iris pallida]|uniref:Uncharacterized protein n=1 Tax=Iris pallida TaxID=29817 RepID=A0AAX6G535_IRIPA|nr:uncharacterized protein M6B38_384285 [Iris pallida]